MALEATTFAWVVQCADSLALSLLAYGLMPSHSTFPHDPPERNVSVTLDSQLVGARSHMRCRHMNAAYFLPPADRHCAARAEGKEGCACDTVACQEHCRLATPRDPEAAYVFYKGSNQSHTVPTAAHPSRQAGASPGRDAAKRDTPGQTGRGKHHFGYKSKAFNVLDDRLFTCWPLPGPYVAADRIPAYAGTICRPSLASPTCANASQTCGSVKSWPTPARATTTSCATFTLTCTPYAWSISGRPKATEIL